MIKDRFTIIITAHNNYLPSNLYNLYKKSVLKNNESSLGIPTFRKPIEGAELNLVYEYIQTNLPSIPRGQCRIIFIEPRLETSFPDIVIVDWHLSTTKYWNKGRGKLTKFDVRLLHYLYIHGISSTNKIQSLFSSSVKPSLERLYNADVISKKGENWRAKPIHKIFAIKRLIAIEAKINEWQKGLHQAMLNTWFASESFLLIPHLPKNSTLLQDAVQSGIGILTKEHTIDNSIVSARKMDIPNSYASWLFNEWVWNLEQIFIHGDSDDKFTLDTATIS